MLRLKLSVSRKGREKNLQVRATAENNSTESPDHSFDRKVSEILVACAGYRPLKACNIWQLTSTIYCQNKKTEKQT